MRTIGQLLETKGTAVETVRPDETVVAAARRMNDRRIGALVVAGPSDETVRGMFTERDVLVRVVAEQRDPASTPVSAVMTSPVFCCTPRTSLDEVRTLMREKRIRHVPVVEEHHLRGIVSIGDLNIVQVNDQQETIQYLEQFLYRP